ncbi:Gfo/Idh/MocA family protein [Natrialbaceae archaeon A-gly3]
MRDSNSLGIGFVGAGFITRTFHAETLRAIRDAHAAAIMNPTRSKAEDVAASVREAGCGDPNVYDELPDLVADPDVEAIWLTSPNYVRLESIETIVEELEDGEADLEAIAIEKPLARTVGEARQVVDLIEEAGLVNAYLENQVYMPGVERMRSLLWDAADAAGRPYLARAAEEHSGPHSGWFWDGEKQGGGALNDMMCHSHKVNRFLLSDPDSDGDLTPVAVSGDISTLKWGREEYADELAEKYDVDYRNHPAEDYARASVFYETDDGELVVGEATNSWGYVGEGLRITVELLGPEYSGTLDTLESGTNVFLSGDIEDEAGYVVEKQEASQGAMSVVPDEATTYGYVAQNRHVVEAFRQGENAREDIHDGLEVVELCMASYKAAEEGERIDLESAGLEEYVPEPARGEFEAGLEGITRE